MTFFLSWIYKHDFKESKDIFPDDIGKVADFRPINSDLIDSVISNKIAKPAESVNGIMNAALRRR